MVWEMAILTPLLFCVLSGILLSCAERGLSLNNGLGRTPQMGWNSWNHYGCNITQYIVEKIADTFIYLGLDKIGYKYINVDDCWALSRDSQGIIQPDTKAFPDFNGMIEYVHSKGLLFGLYSDAGYNTCANRPGSLGYETEDANTYAGWKVDYLKYDNCNSDTIPPTKRFPVMRDALNKTGRPIFYSICEWGVEDPAKWAPDVGNSWRTSPDIEDNWTSMISQADLNNDWAEYAGPGGWNDPDMLEVGNGGMSVIEYETHMSLWCLMKAPLLIGCDVANMSDDTTRILTNSEVIAVNQDSLGVQGKKLNVNGRMEVWGGPLENGNYAVVLLNRGEVEANVTVEWADIGLDSGRTAVVRNLWMQIDMGNFQGHVSSSVPSHGVKMYKITPM